LRCHSVWDLELGSSSVSFFPHGQVGFESNRLLILPRTSSPEVYERIGTYLVTNTVHYILPPLPRLVSIFSALGKLSGMVEAIYHDNVAYIGISTTIGPSFRRVWLFFVFFESLTCPHMRHENCLVWRLECCFFMFLGLLNLATSFMLSIPMSIPNRHAQTSSVSQSSV
jgi:hypothetical protein